MAIHPPILYGLVEKSCRDCLSEISDYGGAFDLFDLPEYDGSVTAKEAFAMAGIRSCCSRNGWHQVMIENLCKSFGIEGLEFAAADTGWFCFWDDDLQIIFERFSQLLAVCESGIPHLGEWEDSWAEDLREHITAYEEATISFDLWDSCIPSCGFEATKHFFSLLKTMHATLAEAIAKDACFLYLLIDL